MTRDLARFRRLTFAATLATLALTSLGALVRATGSGLGCRDEWPTCVGGWIAPFEYHAVIEYSHRAVAGLVVVLLLAAAVAARRWVREERSYFALTLAAFVVVTGQAWLGRLVVTSDLHAALVTAHFVTALAVVGLISWTTAKASMGTRPVAVGAELRTCRLAVGALVALVPLLLVGAYVRERGAGLVFDDWPLMDGRLIPALGDTASLLQFAHRLFALLVGLHLVVLWRRVRRDDRRDVRLLAYGGIGLFLAQAVLGAANVWTSLHPAAVVGHASLPFVTWSAFVALAVVARRGREASAPPPAGPVPRSAFAGVLAFVALTKPRIVVLLLVTTIPAMVLAAQGLPSVWLMVATLVGGMLTSGSANALNQYLERDIDEKMRRTRSRPLPSHSVAPLAALVFAIVLGVVGFVWLATLVNLLSGLLAVAAILFYVGVYTLLLKRTTPQNIVIGGAAGAVPVLVGWAAVTGTVGAPAWVMFLIIFLWTPPHFWALAMRYRDDYAAAGVPMLPVVRGDKSTTAQILAYALVLVAATLSLSPIGGLGALYALSAALLGGGFIYRAVQLRWEPNGETALKLFRYSVSYLGLLFAAIAVDRLVW
jgi:protoheme IX farnesyltransferase